MNNLLEVKTEVPRLEGCPLESARNQNGCLT